MKAILVQAYGGPEVLELGDIATPSPGPGQVLVAVKAIGVNPVDVYLHTGSYTRKIALPYTPGTDAAGVVGAAGAGAPFKAGDRVYLNGAVGGVYAEKAVADANRVFPLPDGLSFEQGAAIGVPFATWMLKGFFDGIPRELEQAAMIDGCGHITAFAYVILPLARPGLAACAIYLAILSWSDFVFARTLINDQARWTVTTGLVSFIGEHGIDWPALMAAGIVSMLPMVVLFLLLEPFLVSGLTAGSQR